ncbi:MAG: RluA family pseudouridine synthase [Clostridia bacterium]|nr:RluA family pseudouridine synthase [Clostridia bacterium]
MEKHIKTTVRTDRDALPIREYLKRQLGFSTSLIAKVKYGGVYLNGTAVHMRATVRDGDTVEVLLPEEDSRGIEPIDIPLDIVYEDEHILAVSKPINMPTHPSRGNSLPTVANAVRAYLGAPFVFRAISRLDRDTSGIVLIAKDRLSGARLCRLMKDGGFTKRYVAHVSGVPSPSEDVIDAPIERECEGSIKRVVREDGKPAITRYRVIKTLPDCSSLCELSPITGRTHQIRVHMAHIGHPLVGDFLYGQRIEGTTYRLHCSSLEFSHPNDGKPLVLYSRPPFCDD